MSSDRAYRASLTRPDVLKEIRRCAGTQFDPTLAVMFVSLNFEQYDEMMNEHRAAEMLAKRGAA
jgi:HD-GYP domain-containing protein (c-di-GMP phosphodiesterase class II)